MPPARLPPLRCASLPGVLDNVGYPLVPELVQASRPLYPAELGCYELYVVWQALCSSQGKLVV